MTGPNLNRTPTLEKILRIGIISGVVFGAAKAWNYVAPTLIQAMKNTWLFAGLAVPTVIVFGWLLMNPKLVYMWYLGLCKKITGWFIKMDPLSIMDGYLALLRKKYANLEKIRIIIEGKKTKLERLIKDKVEEYEDLTSLAMAARKQGEERAAASNANKAVQIRKTVDLYRPIYDRYVKNTTFLKALSENWHMAIDNLSFTIENKREEFENLKEMFKGLKTAEDFINSDSDEARIFAMSLKALEEDVSHKIAYIEDFEKKAQPLLTNMNIQKQADEQKALDYLDQLMKQDLSLPNYQEFTMPITNGLQKQAVTIPYEEVKSKYGI